MAQLELGRKPEVSVKLHFPPDQNYDCVMCGRGCETLWSIPVEPTVAERLESHPLGLRLIDEQGAAFERLEDGSIVIYYADKEKPRCGFLDEQKLCQVHAQLGMEAKPTSCQQFPFQVTETPDGVYVGVSFFCTSVRQNSGRPLAEHEPWLRDLMRRGIGVATIEADRVEVASAIYTQWSDYVSFEAEFREKMAQQGLDLTVQQALVACARASQQSPCRLAAGLSHFEVDEAPLGGQISSMLDTLLFTLVKLFLDDTTPERIAALDQAYFEGQSLSLSEFQWQGSWHELIRFQDGAVSESFEDDLDRWAEMQIHRKALLIRRPLLDNLWMLVLIPRYVRLATALHAQRAGRSQASSEDFFEALERAEMYLGTNGLLPNRIGPRYTELLLEIVQEAGA